MNILKIITFINWGIIAVLGVVVIAGIFTSSKGGEAAGRGYAQFYYMVAVAAFVVLIILNVLPYTWTKYTALAIIVLPFLFTKISPVITKYKQRFTAMAEDAKPIFDDPEREKIARAIHNGQPDKLRDLLSKPVARLNEKGELLCYAVMEACHSYYKPDEKLTCLKIMLDNGASLDSANTIEAPIHMSAASTGNAAVLRLLLEHGAKPNARDYYSTRHIIFEAVEASKDPEVCVRVLLDFGADMNVVALFDDEKGKVTPLYRAAQLGRWGVCALLLEKGADRNTSAADGTSLKSMYEEALKDFHPDGYTTKEDLLRVMSYKL